MEGKKKSEEEKRIYRLYTVDFHTVIHASERKIDLSIKQHLSIRRESFDSDCLLYKGYKDTVGYPLRKLYS